MGPEAVVTVVLFIPNQNGTYETREFHGVTVNKQAPVRMILQGIISGLSQIGIRLDIDQVDMLFQAPDGSTLSSLNLQDGGRIVLIPRFVGPAVRFPSQ